MSDIADLANEAAAQSLANHLATVRGELTPLQKTGYCYFCHEVVSETFCDADCRDDFQREQAQLQKLGRA